MIQTTQIKEAATRAYKKKEFYEFLTGRADYSLSVIDISIDVPTDWTRIIPQGIYAIYNESGDDNIKTAYEAAIEKMIQGSPKDIWQSVYIVFIQKDMEQQGESPFTINEAILERMKLRVRECKKKLDAVSAFGDENYSMYDDIWRLNSNYKKDWGKVLVPLEA